APQFELEPTATIDLLEWKIAPTASYGDITHFAFEMDYISGGLRTPILGGGPPLSPPGTFSFDGFVAVPEPSAMGLVALLGGMGFLRHRRRAS
ncbi:MAG: PEP-CTERM sorting domain-containing protein, partial [Planctomycetota bacterium]